MPAVLFGIFGRSAVRIILHVCIKKFIWINDCCAIKTESSDHAYFCNEKYMNSKKSFFTNLVWKNLFDIITNFQSFSVFCLPNLKGLHWLKT